MRRPSSAHFYLSCWCLALSISWTQAAQAQTYSVLHTFTDGQDGAFPEASLSMDVAGNLYGTALLGGTSYGTVYRLKRKGSNWIVNPLYSFAGGSDGAYPRARVVFGPDGGLYGTTSAGGGSELCSGGCGTVFTVRTSATACTAALCPWTETVLYRFVGSADGANPYGDLVFDQAGNIYGTTFRGGSNGMGTVYELTPSANGWTQNILHTFSGSDGAYPVAGVIFDNLGNLYGTTTEGGPSNGGTVFRLTPSGSGWTESVLYAFQDGADGSTIGAGLMLDPSGNLYGASQYGGLGGGGTVFKLTASSGKWAYSLVYSFTGGHSSACGPSGTLVMDGAGSIYGTTVCDGAEDFGDVFKLTPLGGGWTYTSLHDFTGGSDGASPYCGVVFDASANIYGTAVGGGSMGAGVVWEITP